MSHSNPVRPRIVVFDLGKVLLDFDYGIAIRALAKDATASVESIRQLIDQSPLLFQYETGLITTEEFYNTACQSTGYRGGAEQFSQLFAEIFAEIDSMVELHEHLRAADFPTYIFSNTNEIAIRHIRERFPFFSRFTNYIYSYEVKSMKPDARIYEALEAVSGCRGEEILYIDDRIENIEAGKKRGWQSIHHTDPSLTRNLVIKSTRLAPIT